MMQQLQSVGFGEIYRPTLNGKAIAKGLSDREKDLAGVSLNSLLPPSTSELRFPRLTALANDEAVVATGRDALDFLGGVIEHVETSPTEEGGRPTPEDKSTLLNVLGGTTLKGSFMPESLLSRALGLVKLVPNPVRVDVSERLFASKPVIDLPLDNVSLR